MKNKIKEFAASLGIEYSGIAEYKERSYMAVLFPYYVSNEEGNISKYARSYDYHKIANDYLKKIQSFISQNEIKTEGTYVDSGRLPERFLAHLAGLGRIGKNGCLINEKYGSFVFIGVIALKDRIEPDKATEKACIQCGKCINSCPAQAFENGFEKEKCISFISQKKEELTENEKKLLKERNIVWGCDICQDVCPLNNNFHKTPLPEFYKNRITSLDKIDWINEGDFKNKFDEYAFSWRGAGVIERNIKNLYGG